MPAADLVIKNGTIVTSREIFDGSITINDGRITKVSRSAFSGEAAHKIECRGMLVLPGVFDPHVHFRDPGFTYKEDFETGSKGAAAGGVTTVFDMPTTSPAVTDVPSFRNKVREVKKKALVDFGLYAGAGPENIRDFHPLAREGAIAFKTYMVAPPPERLREYEGTFVRTNAELYSVMRAVNTTGLLHCLHAEDNLLVDFLSTELRRSGRRDPLAHYDSRPDFTESIAVFVATSLAGRIQARIHILHLSTKEGLEIIKRARRYRVSVTCETCPHYLLFTKTILEKSGSFAKYNPPARNQEDMIALRKGLADRSVDIIASDHAPHSRDEKESGIADIWKAPPGTPGVETMLPILLTRARSWGIGLNRLVQLTSTRSAEIFGVSDTKGDIRAGIDADFTVVDQKEEWGIDPKLLQTKSRETVLYKSLQLRGKVKMTIVRGEVVYEEGVGFGKVGWGRFIPGKGGRPKVRAT